MPVHIPDAKHPSPLHIPGCKNCLSCHPSSQPTTLHPTCLDHPAAPASTVSSTNDSKTILTPQKDLTTNSCVLLQRLKSPPFQPQKQYHPGTPLLAPTYSKSRYVRFVRHCSAGDSAVTPSWPRALRLRAGDEVRWVTYVERKVFVLGWKSSRL